MDFHFTESQQALRSELREFISTEMPPWWKAWGPIEGYTRADYQPTAREMSKKLAARGWLTMSWPREYGGLEAPNLDYLVYREETAFHMVPGTDMGVGGVSWIGPSLMLFGSEAQKRRHLPAIASGDVFWCTGYSEPDSGSDLASLKSRATRRGDGFVLNGQKVWTSGAHCFDWCWLAVRTDPDVRKHKGISLLLLDLTSPGVTVRPLMNLAGYEGFCEIFLDDVHVPMDCLVGEENQGWYYIVKALDFERTAAIDYLSRARSLLFLLLDYARAPSGGTGVWGTDKATRHRLADLFVESEIGRMMCYRIAWMGDHGITPNYETSMVKNLSAELGQKIANVATQMLGMYGQLGDVPQAVLEGRAEHAYLATRADTIAAGTSEVNRNIIATRGLGLPRD
jgi:alkylation response protein AidB-like acyl-CoA dehydrogenase